MCNVECKIGSPEYHGFSIGHLTFYILDFPGKPSLYGMRIMVINC